MIATFVMTGDWIELPIDSGIDKKKIEDRITAKNSVTDGWGALYDSICITAGEDNGGTVLVSDYTEDNQTNDGNVADYIELAPSGRIELPWNRQVQALNRPIVMGQAGDILKVIAR